ncbi:DUF4114 domain-containing protein [Spirulina major]|uniref:DUF4114 domain-containing protein n=1 Tax=Spirulina major TaxID=270636 RepID=UPI000933460D|nr:DUF4114 domain-containing protein [Spirulina major]
MKSFTLKTLSLTLAAATALFSAGAANAQAMNLRDSNEDLFNLFNSMVNSERLEIKDSAAKLIDLDPETLRWLDGAQPLEVYFINEGASLRNILSYSVNSGEKQTIFSDVSSSESIIAEADGALRLGDGVSLGTFTGDTQLDFYLKQYNAKTGNSRYTFGTKAGENPDGLQHFIARSYYDEATAEYWTLIGVEDLFGTKESGKSDRDFNDAVFAVRGLTGDPVPGTTPVPEPATLLGLLGVAALGALKVRRDEA